MMDLVNEYGTKHWGLIGEKLNDRTGKQVGNRGSSWLEWSGVMCLGCVCV
jgi:hypothetical protein